MHNYNDLFLFQKTYDLVLWLHPILNKFPKSQKFVLAQRIENCLIEVLEDLVKLNSQKLKSDILMEDLNVKIDRLRILVRLAKDLKFISVKSYGVFAERVTEVGKLLGGFKKFKNT
jgi:hypothetical protein